MSPHKKIVFEACDPSQVEMVTSAYYAAWDIICPRQIKTGSPREIELRTDLVRCIEKLALRGFKDSDELTKRCVEEMLLGKRSLWRGP